MSELIDPPTARALVVQAASGVDINVHVRELDPLSARLILDALACHSDLRLEDSSWWELPPHFNVIVADGCAAYVGSSYLWSTQSNMIFHGRSFENGVLLDGDAAGSVLDQINKLRTQARQRIPPAVAYDFRRSWDKYRRMYLENIFD